MDGKHQTAKRSVPEQRGGGADDAEPPSQRRRVAALREVCEETEPANFYEARLKHIAKLTKNDAKIVKVVPRAEATSRPLSGRWVETQHDDGALKARWTTRGFEQTLQGNEDFSQRRRPRCT